MASGYLGKISAVVSANTAGYVRTLNEAAKETKSFAKTVQSDITRASNEAKRAFDSMYTPIQRVERALKAASSQKLSFKGFDGGIKTIDQLKRSLSSLRQATNIALKITGKESLTQLRQEIDSLGSDVQQSLVANFEVTNIEQVKRLLNSVGSRGAIETSFKVLGAQNLDQLIERLDTLAPKDVQIVLDTVNQGGLNKAVDQLRKLKSVADQLAAPLGIAVKEFGQLGATVQAGFIPALSQVQNEVSAMERSIKQGTGASENKFLSLEGKVQRVTAAISRLSQAADITAGMRTGQELEFTDPNLQQRLLNARQASDAAANIPASRRQSDGQIREIVSNLQKATQESLRLQANLEKTRATGLLTDVIRAEDELEDSLTVVDGLTQKLQAKNQVEQRAADLEERRLATQKRRLENANALLNVSVLEGNNNLTTEYAAMLEKIADKERRIVVNREKAISASSFLFGPRAFTGDEDPSGLGIGARTRLDPVFLQSNTEDKASRELGANISKASRDMDKLRSKTVSLRDTIETLPNSVASGLIPQLKRAEQEFIRLRASASASEEEIENASNEVDRLAASVRRVGSTQGISTFAEAFDDAEIRGALGSLTALQQMLLRIGATAGDEAAVAFEEMRVAVQQATLAGRIGTDEFNEELEELIHNAANAASRVGNIKAGAAFNEIKRGGDVARGGFDKMSLGLQQAAFAIDDFFSATGDISQKIRAVQNNITQLAFVVGGTKGLFIGLGVAIAAQATLALAKWINGGVGATEQTDLLNESLERQKQIVEALKAAFDSLRDSLSDGIFSDAQQSSREFRDEIKRLTKAQEDSREERAARFDADVQQVSAERKVLEGRLEGATSGGQRVAIERELDELEKREKALRQTAVDRPPPDIDELVRIGRQTVRASEFGGGRVTSESQRRATERADTLEDEIRNATSAQEIADALDRRIAERQKVASQNVGFLDFFETGPGSAPEIFRAREDVANLEQQKAALEIPLTAERDALIVSALEFSQGVSSSLVEAKDIVQNSLEEFDSVAVTRNRLAEQFNKITEQLTDPDADLSQDQVTQLQQQQEALKQQIDANLSAARSAETFAETLNRVAGDLSDTLLSEATSDSEQARRDLNEAIGRREALGPNATDEQRRRADADVEIATRNKRLAEDAQKIARDERQAIAEQRRREQEDFNQDARRGMLSPEANAAIKEREKADKEVAKREKERARIAAIPEFIRAPSALEREDRRLADAQRRRQEVQERTEGTLQDAFENRPGVQDLRDRADELDIELAKRKALAEIAAADDSASIERGREFTLSDTQKRAEELERQANDIENALRQELDTSGRDAALQGLNNARGSFFQGTIMAGFQQERRNALLQGPSRAALQATDVTTVQGQSELNRLIRGEDSALDVNLVELQKQSEELARINERLDQVGNSLGIL